MSEIVYQEEIGNHRIVIRYDHDLCDSPRDWSSFGTMVCWHRRYSLGDRHNHDSPYIFLCDLAEVNEDRDLSFDALYQRIERKAVMLPLYLHDHSGITMNTTGFHCPWDSGQVGFIYVSLANIRKDYKTKLVTKKYREKARQLLVAEVSTYDDYLRGEVYGFEIIKDDEVIDSCWGFLGDYEKDCLLEARRTITAAA